MKEENISTGISILLVDDDQEIITALTKAITIKAKTFNIEIRAIYTANDGAEAIAKIKNQTFDFIILDNDMPRKNGLAVLKFMSENKDKDKEIQKTKVIFLSGELKVKTLQSLKKLNVIDVLTKPFDIDRIILNIKKNMG